MILEWNYLVSSFLELVELYAKESPYPVQYSEKDAVSYTFQILFNPDADILIKVQDDTVVAACLVLRHKEFFERYSGVLQYFYVHPKYRKSPVARELLQDAVHWFDTNDCYFSVAASNSGIGKDKLFINLLSKVGYVQQHNVLIRKGIK